MPNTQFNTLLDILSSLSSQNTNFQSVLSTIGCSFAVSLVDFSCPLHLLSPGSSLLSTSFFFSSLSSSSLFFLFLFFYSLIILLTYMTSFHGFKTVNIPTVSKFLPPTQVYPKLYIFNDLKYSSCQHVQNTVCHIPSEISSISADGKSILPAAYIETLE